MAIDLYMPATQMRCNRREEKKIREVMQHIVSMTGFSNDPKEQEYKEIIGRLGMRFASVLADKTTVLIVKEVSTEKYKIARFYEKTMACVTIDWLIESQRENKVLEVEPFKVKHIFYGVQLHLLGFTKQITANIKHRIEDNGGIVHELDENSLEEVLKKHQIKILLASNEAYELIKSHKISETMFPIVGIQWLQASLNLQSCKFPYDYALNQFELGRKETIQHYKKMKTKLDGALAMVNKADNRTMFENTLINIDKNVDHRMVKLLQQLIAINGGFYLDEIHPVVTHVLIEPIQNLEYYSFLAHGAMTKILRVEWLLDSIYLNTKMPEQDYLICSFKKRTWNADQVDQKSVSSSQASRNLASLSWLILNSKKSISMPKTMTKTSYVPNNKQKYRPISNIFQGKHFYIQSSQRKQEELRSLFSQITKNGGKISSSRRDIKCDLCYYVLSDASNCNSLIQTLKLQTKDTQIQPVSYRWVRECINKVEFLDILKYKSFVYKPFPFKLPIQGFYKHIFDVIGMDLISKTRVIQLYKILGSSKILANKSQLSHCLCGQDYLQCPKYHEIRQQNPTTIFLDWKWLIECANTGKVADYDPFIIRYQAAVKQQFINSAN